jgi:hypothetical protein
MADVWRGDNPRRDPEYPQSGELESIDAPGDFFYRSGRHSGVPLAGMPTGSNLPAENFSVYRNKRRLNRSAETIGYGVGTCVATVLRFPRHVEAAKSKLRGLGDTASVNTAAAAVELLDKAVEQADVLKKTASHRAAAWREAVDARFSQLTHESSAQLQKLRSATAGELRKASRTAQARIVDARRRVQEWEREYPLEMIAGFAAAAFVAGLALRVWRSNREQWD